MNETDEGKGAPILNLPPMARNLILLNLVVHGARWFAADDEALVMALGFVPARYGAGEPGWQAVVSPLTYQILHGGIGHLAINMVSLAAFGTAMERALGPWRMLSLAILAGFVAALAHWALDPGSPVPMIGASGAISGLFGGALMMLRDFGRMGPGRRQLLLLSALWIALAALGGGTDLDDAGGTKVAWAAHVGGFLAGLALWRPFVGAPRRP